jgi:Rhodanese-like domain
MAMKQYWTIVALLAAFVLTGCLQNLAPGASVPRMTKEELKPLLGSSEVVVLDVRLEGEWNRSGLKIQGAVREDPEKDYKTWASKYPKDKTLVFYCS